MVSNSAHNRARHWFAVFSACATLGLILVGGLVTSHGVGMSVPDWPNTYGYNMFFFPFSKWAGGIFYEHSHRLVASAVGLLTVILAFWLHGRGARKWLRICGSVLLLAGIASWITFPQRWTDAVVLLMTGLAGVSAALVWPGSDPAPKWLRRLGLIAVAAVIVQGVLGGLRVTHIKDELGIFHATLAQAFFVLMCAIALFTARWWSNRSGQQQQVSPEQAHALRGLAPFYLTTTALILVQLALGATMRHQHAGLAIPDFPLAYGKLWPDTNPSSIELYNQQRLEVVAVKPITAGQIHLQMTHRVMALLILISVTCCAWLTLKRIRGKNFWTISAWGWAGLILTQVLLGAATIWSGKAADIATAHVFFGALSLALGSLICIVSIHAAKSIIKIKPAARSAPDSSRDPFGSQTSAAN